MPKTNRILARKIYSDPNSSGGDDTLIGSYGNDFIFGLAGNDKIRALSGDDFGYGGPRVANDNYVEQRQVIGDK